MQGISLALNKDCPIDAYNVGTGVKTSILYLANCLAKALHFNGEISPTGRIRRGDILHCVADIGKISNVLGYASKMSLDKGLQDLIGWAAEQKSDDHVNVAVDELVSRGLLE